MKRIKTPITLLSIRKMLVLIVLGTVIQPSSLLSQTGLYVSLDRSFAYDGANTLSIGVNESAPNFNFGLGVYYTNYLENKSGLFNFSGSSKGIGTRAYYLRFLDKGKGVGMFGGISTQLKLSQSHPYFGSRNGISLTALGQLGYQFIANESTLIKIQYSLNFGILASCYFNQLENCSAGQIGSSFYLGEYRSLA